MATTRAAKARAADLVVYDEFGSQHPASEAKQDEEASGLDPQDCLSAQQWLTLLAQWCEGAEGASVKQQLSELLRCGSRSKDKLVAVANRARQQIGSIFSWTHHVDDPPGADTPARARQCQYLFERALHGVLLTAVAEEEKERSGGGGGGGSPASPAGGSPAGGTLSPGARSRVVEAMLADEEYQLGLVHACIEVVNFAYLRSPAETFPWVALHLRRMHHGVELWQGIDWVVDHLSSPPAGAEGIVPDMPETAVCYLSAIQVRVEEELAFIDGSSIYKRIVATGATWTGGAGGGASDSEATESEAESASGRRRRQRSRASHTPRGSGPDAALVARFLSNLAHTAMLRTSYVSKELLYAHPTLADVCPDLQARACAVMDAVLGDQLDLLFGQHVSVAIACALFYTIRVHGGSMPFRKLTALMAALLPNHDDATFGRVELPLEDGSGWDGSRDYGDTRAFYNRVFLPAFADFDPADLFGDKSMGATPTKAQLEAPAPESAAPANGHLLTHRGSDGGGRHSGLAAPAAMTAGGSVDPKEFKRLRRPLGQVTNGASGSGGNSGKVAAGAQRAP